MKPGNPRILTVNGGSSSIKFALFELEEKRNAANEAVISATADRVAVRVIRTDEEWMIASTVCRVLSLTVE